jgi:hypothetical protein
MDTGTWKTKTSLAQRLKGESNHGRLYQEHGLKVTGRTQINLRFKKSREKMYFCLSNKSSGTVELIPPKRMILLSHRHRLTG